MKLVALLNGFCELCERQLKETYGEDNIKIIRESLGYDNNRIINAAREAEILVVSTQKIDNHILDSLPKLKILIRRGLGFDNIDVRACAAHGIQFSRTEGAVEFAVAEQIISYILYFARRVDKQSSELKKGIWNRELQFGASGRTLGLIGFGTISKKAASIALALGMNVIATSHHENIGDNVGGVLILSEEEVLENSDFVSINIPLRESTRNYAGKRFFDKMKRGAYFINTARSGIVNMDALIEAIEKQRVGGVAIDVFDQEPCVNSPLARFGNDIVILTPHSSPRTEFSQINLDQCVVDTIVKLAGTR